MIISSVGFDINGTLLADRENLFKALNAVFLEYGRKPLSEEEICEEMGHPWTQIYRTRGLSEEEAPHKECARIYDRAYLNSPLPKAAPGIKMTLETLQGWGMDLIALSAQSNHVNLPLLDRLKLADYFLEIYGGASDKAKVLKEYLSHYNIPAREMLYIGDHESDMLFAKQVGCWAIGYSHGVHSPKRLNAAGADYILDDFALLPPLIAAH